MILNKDEFIEAYTHLRKIEIAIEEKNEFKLAVLIKQLKYRYNLRLEVIESDMIVSTNEPEASL